MNTDVPSFKPSTYTAKERSDAKIRAFMGQKPDGFESLEEVAAAIASYQPHRQRKRNLDGRER